MEKPYTTVHPIRGKEPFLRRLVCEVRFDDGHLYLDHTGRLLKKLVKSADWLVISEPTPKATTLFHPSLGFQLSFSMAAASLSLDRAHTDEVISESDITEFINQTDQSLGFVLDELEAVEFTRMGFRQVYSFSFESKEESEEWLRELNLNVVSPKLCETFQTKPDAMSFSLVMRGENYGYRIALHGIEGAAQIPMGENVLNIRASATSAKQNKVLREVLKKKRKRQIGSLFAIELDIDSFRENPLELELASFLRECIATNLDRFRASLPNSPEKKGKQ